MTTKGTLGCSWWNWNP